MKLIEKATAPELGKMPKRWAFPAMKGRLLSTGWVFYLHGLLREEMGGSALFSI